MRPAGDISLEMKKEKQKRRMSPCKVCLRVLPRPTDTTSSHTTLSLIKHASSIDDWVVEDLVANHYSEADLVTDVAFFQLVLFWLQL